MDLLKRHLFLIICGAVAAASIALAVLGINSMSAVKDSLARASQLAGNLQRPGQPINITHIEAERDRIDQIEKHYTAVIDWSKQRNLAQPLIPNAFPEPDRNQRLDFKDAYGRRLRELLDMLDPGTVASGQDITEMAELIAEEDEAERWEGAALDDVDQAPTMPGAEEEQPAEYRSTLLTDYGARKDAAARANITKAHQFRCYADMYALEVMGGILEPDVITPDDLAMWDAQVSLWVQESVIAALARVNEEAANRLQAEGETAWVGNMPVKEFTSIRTSPYIIPDMEPKSPARPGGSVAARPPESADEVFTHSVSNYLYEVVQFTVEMVVDARQVPTIVNEICRDNFHTPLRIAYMDVSTKPSSWSMKGKVYGADPSVRVVMDFETIFLGDIYRRLMPETILGELGVERPEPEEEEDEA